MTSTQNIRQAPEAPYTHRLVERVDIAPGCEDIVMIDLTHWQPNLHSALWKTWKIRLDDEPLQETERGLYVFYHTIKPGEPYSCAVSLDDFLGNEEFDFCDYTRYWIKFDQVVIRII